MSKLILALDQGTTSSRSILFDHRGRMRAVAQSEHEQLYPSPGHVAHDPEQIWKTQLGTAKRALKKAKRPAGALAAIGITNQRETVVLWERDTGRPVDHAIVWQSRITAPFCDRLKRAGHTEMVRAKTGLVIDAYFSGTKIRHLLKKHKLTRRARMGEILAGTVDSFLLYRLTGGQVHATDPSNASRTMLFNIHQLDWDDELLELLQVPREMLPEVRDSSGMFGDTQRSLLGASVPVMGIAGDQQAATFGQACFRRGMIKATYGTGAFILMNTGDVPVGTASGLLTTIGWRIAGKTTYCLEGSVFVAGAAVQWLRDGLGLIRRSVDVEKLAASVPDAGGVYLVPAFVGLGTPHWDPYARGIIVGLERSTNAGHVARATVESIAYQVRDVVATMEVEASIRLRELRVDGGAAANNALLSFQADLLGKTVRRPRIVETTARGAAFLAGLAAGYWKSLREVQSLWREDREFRSGMKPAERQQRVRQWERAVDRAKGWLDEKK